ncbi:MarR family transcriptional regulator [Streptomyces sp. NPDC026673]|uniref:MarR family winged helix-turn-helix transcriptional regulator n=1 Tax=Streptomyces sp. NPDC026673 TaxID=3155724 RepID=UPI003403D876
MQVDQRLPDIPVDERTVRPLSGEEQEFIYSLTRAISVFPRAIDAELNRNAGLLFSEYTPLVHLSGAPQQRMRMSELAAACNFSLGGMTRVIIRLEKQGCVMRVQSSQDGRAWNAVLTDAGRARLQVAGSAFLICVRHHLMNHFEGHDLPRLTAAFNSVAVASDSPQT